MVRIPDSEFTKGLYVSATEVPWEVFEIWALQLDQTAEEQTKFKPDALSRPSRPYAVIFTGFGHHEFPANCISSNSAIEFCKWLTTKTGKKYRLPTRMEWEFFAGKQGGVDEVAWHWDNAEDTTHKVGTKKPNSFGLYDALGNVAEWTTDKDGKFGASGGSWKTKPVDLTTNLWQPFDPKWNEADPQNPKSKWWLANGQHIGIRVVCTK
jgi:formylglycine-generating enzyme required for sulfatase activity